LKVGVPVRTDAGGAARAAGLRWVSDRAPGIRRLRRGRGFVYRRPDGSAVGDAHVLARIRGLVIPPAWERVWICERADGHVQATGYDARGRKQYRYHADWRRVREEHKYARVVAFGRRLPAIRRRLAADLARDGLPREKVIATVIHLLDATTMRIGNAEYARANGSYGLTTLRGRHAAVAGDRVRFRFRGKSGVVHEVDVADRRVARIVRRCQELPGQELFTWVAEDGGVRGVGSGDVNDYLRGVAGMDFSAKDFRTWAGTLGAACALAAAPVPATERLRRRAVVGAVKQVAAQLGNTVAVCRRSYIHPAVLTAFAEGRTLATLTGRRSFARLRRSGLERALLRLLAAGTMRARPAVRATA
jgi:DNA topoisomerase-1